MSDPTPILALAKGQYGIRFDAVLLDVDGTPMALSLDQQNKVYRLSIEFRDPEGRIFTRTAQADGNVVFWTSTADDNMIGDGPPGPWHYRPVAIVGADDGSGFVPEYAVTSPQSVLFYVTD